MLLVVNKLIYWFDADMQKTLLISADADVFVNEQTHQAQTPPSPETHTQMETRLE